jgi:RNase P/RNase MRP subunit p29
VPQERILSVVLGAPPSYRNPITVEQLRSLATTRADVELRVGETGTKATKDIIVVDPTGKAGGTLFLIDGRLQIRNPDDRTIEWMLELGAALNGRVVDSTRRTYRTSHETYVHPDDVESRKAHARRIRIARNKFIPFTHTIIKWTIIGFFALLAVISFAMFDR